MSETLHEAIFSAASARRDKTAFHYYHQDGWRSVSYGDFLKTAGAFAGRLGERGVEGEERVALMAENRFEWCAAYLGILMCGATAVPIDARLTPPEVRNILRDSESRVSLHSEETEEAVRLASEGLPVELLALESGSPEEPPEEPEDERAPREAGGAGGLASLLYTSGTTGTPKAVMLTHENFLSDAASVLGMNLMGEDDNVLAVLPLHHSYAFMCTFVVPLLAGVTITYPQGLKGPQILEAVRATGVTALIAVPQLLELMRNRSLEKIGSLPTPLSLAVRGLLRMSGYLRRSLGVNLMGRLSAPLGRQFRYFTSGGARLDPLVMTDLEALGFTVVEGYGLSETSPIVSFNPIGKRKPGSVGRAVPGAEIRILNPSETGEGEVAVRGPMVMKGYYRKAEETASVLQDGWFRTGDLGYLDKEGYLFITGRLKEVIVLSSGKNIYPEEVERHYLAGPLVGEICVMEEAGKLKAVVVPDMHYAKEHRMGNLAEIVKWEMNVLSQTLPPHMRVKGVSLRGEPLPRTPLGKLKRYAVSSAETEPPPREEGRPLPGDETGRAVLAALKSLLPEGTLVRQEDNLELDLGVDSLRRVELAAKIEQELAVQLPEGFMADAHTVTELYEGTKGILDRGGEYVLTEAAGIEGVLTRTPSEEEQLRAGLVRGPSDWPFSVFFMGVVRSIMRLAWGLRGRGLEHLPERPYIIAANHTSYLDGFAVGAAVPLRVFKNLYFLGERKFFTGRLTALFARLAHVITIDQDTRLDTALELSATALRRHGSLVIFPEGGRSPDGKLMEFRPGIGILALNLGVPVVPAHIAGTHRVLPRGAGRPGLGTIEVTFGPPLSPDEFKPGGEGEKYVQFAREIRSRLERLSPS
jgi:long-chain acyl-CoA synthetase